jgi:hypothetical protein
MATLSISGYLRNFTGADFFACSGTTFSGVTAGKPGSFQPNGISPPATLAALQGNAIIGNSGSNKPGATWTAGQYVVLDDSSNAYWNGTAWTAGSVPGGTGGTGGLFAATSAPAPNG